MARVFVGVTVFDMTETSANLSHGDHEPGCLCQQLDDVQRTGWSCVWGVQQSYFYDEENGDRVISATYGRDLSGTVVVLTHDGSDVRDVSRLMPGADASQAMLFAADQVECLVAEFSEGSGYW